ncbi:MAG: indole-3-glycerol-phosphate synthase [Planctomycetes bacterium]|nr:indole-3-glycerol-phosphate synthase [Planctomycetota bacterium]
MSGYQMPSAVAQTRLAPILDSVLQRLAQRKDQCGLAELHLQTVPDLQRRPRFVTALKNSDVAVIAECKRRSPSAGMLLDDQNLAARAQNYAHGGAAALSILTEEDHFKGGLIELQNVADAGLPRLRKDFILDEYMVLESINAGADAILLMVVCLDDVLLAELRAQAAELGLAVLLEVHDEAELERAITVAPDCLGVNARNLTTFHVELAHTVAMLPHIPNQFVRVAESGLRTPADVARVAAAGADAVLIGEALMKANDPAQLIREFQVAAQEARA